VTEDAREALQRRLAEMEQIDDPFAGRSGPGEFREQSRIWPDERWAQVELLASVVDGPRSVEEYRFVAADPDGPTLGAAVVWEGDQAWAYYSPRVFGREEIRTAVLPTREDLLLDGVVGSYQRALKAGDTEALMATVEEATRFQDPSGGVLAGTERLRELFGRFEARGGVPLEYCRVTDDGTTCAVEFTSRSQNPPRAGIGLYERGPSGKLVFLRVYE
jgi:hypothetical protein